MKNFDISYDDERKACRRFFSTLVALVIVSVIIISFFLSVKSRELLAMEMLAMARAHFHNIKLVRLWAAEYGGVYVKKSVGEEPSPFLKNPFLHTEEGIVLTLKHPALITREISELASIEEGYSFHITSLDPINPENVPDTFETRALESFEKGVKEAYEITEENLVQYYSYIAPLYVEKPCLKCHAAQGYKVGDVRGGIRVKFSMQPFENMRNRAVLQIIMLSSLAGSVLIVLLYLLMHRFELRLSSARKRIKELAVTDSLTGICNRGCLMSRLEEELERMARSGKPMGCLMLDLDNFKNINDTHGHQFGDQVLREMCARVMAVIRPYDLLARYGGEEFVVLLPEADLIICGQVAERILQVVNSSPFEYNGISAIVTVSIGGTCAASPDIDISTLLKNADSALYHAKAAGRNRVVMENCNA